VADFRFRNSWSDAARVDPRFRDPVAPLDRPEVLVLPAIAAAPGAPGLDLVVVEELPRAALDESWGSPHASPATKITAAVLAEALELRQAGWSWPAIAKHFGVHRNSLWHARQR
jgi:hypothetical protein